jgi:hypothetical protein
VKAALFFIEREFTFTAVILGPTEKNRIHACSFSAPITERVRPSSDVFLNMLRSGQLGGQKSLCPLEKPLQFTDYVFCLHKNNNLPHD